MKTILASVLIACSFTANAIRCGSLLIEIGDPLIKVRENCQVIGEYRTSNNNTDLLIVYVRECLSGMASIKLIDGIVKEIE
jgi:hypothetical protein